MGLINNKSPDCEICLRRSYHWAIRKPLWNSTRCWQHMSPSQREHWLQNFLDIVKQPRGLIKSEADNLYDVIRLSVLDERIEMLERKFGKDNTLELEYYLESSHIDKLVSHELEKRLTGSIINLRDIDLAGCDLSDSDFRQTDCSGTNFTGARLIRADLTGSSFTKAAFKDADLTEARAHESVFSSAAFQNAILTSARLQSSNFSGTILHGTQFDGAQLVNTTFDECDAMGANFTEANLSKASFVASNLKNTSFVRANLSEVDLSGANLSESVLADAELKLAKVDGTNLTHTDLRGANIAALELYKAQLQDTKVYFEDLHFAVLLTPQIALPYLVIERKNKPKVFICYSHHDHAFVARMETALRARSIDVWIDREEISVGDSLLEKITEGIETSRLFMRCNFSKLGGLKLGSHRTRDGHESPPKWW